MLVASVIALFGGVLSHFVVGLVGSPTPLHLVLVSLVMLALTLARDPLIQVVVSLTAWFLTTIAAPTAVVLMSVLAVLKPMTLLSIFAVVQYTVETSPRLSFSLVFFTVFHYIAPLWFSVRVNVTMKLREVCIGVIQCYLMFDPVLRGAILAALYQFMWLAPFWLVLACHLVLIHGIMCFTHRRLDCPVLGIFVLLNPYAWLAFLVYQIVTWVETYIARFLVALLQGAHMTMPGIFIFSVDYCHICIALLLYYPIWKWVFSFLWFQASSEAMDPPVSGHRPVRLQAGKTRLTESISDLLAGFRSFTDAQSPDAQKTLSVIFDVTMLIYQLSRSRSKCDVAAAIGVFCKSRWTDLTVEANVLAMFYSLFGDEDIETQAFSDWVSLGHSKFQEARSLRSSPGAAKVHRFAMYALSLGLFKSVGIDMDNAGFTRIEQAAARKKFRMDVNFIDSVLEMSLFIVTAGHQAFQGCGLGQILHSGQAYSKLFEEFRVFSGDFDLYSETGIASGVDHTKLMGRCELLKDQFASVLPMVESLSKPEKRFVRDLHSKLLAIEAKLKSVKIAMANRPAPFSILVTGASSVGKSSIVDILFSYYGKLHELDTSSDNRYVVSNVAEYWDNFQSHMWAIVLDDIGFRHPGLGQVDNSVDQILNIVNNVAMMPNQAAIEKKGKTPLLARMVIATTNTPDLNAKAYYSNPGAVLRRFPYVVEVQVRDEFATPLGGLDPTKIPANVAYPDFWNLTVTRVEAKNVKQVERVQVETFTSMGAFLTWYKTVIEQFNENQRKTIVSSEAVLAAGNCTNCSLPTPLCGCMVTVQSGLETYMYWSLRFAMWYAAMEVMGFLHWFLTHPVSGALFKIVLHMEFQRLYHSDFGRSCRQARATISGLLLPPGGVMHHIGERVRTRVVRVPRLFSVLAILLTTAVGLSVLYRAFVPRVQGLSHSKGTPVRPFTKERENIYYNDGSLRSDFEGSPLGHSMSTSQFVANVSHNVVLGNFRDDSGVVTHCRLVGLAGSYFLTNNHSIPVGVNQGKITLGNRRNGVCQSITCVVSEHDVVRDFRKDLCIVRLRAVPPRRNILQYFGGEPSFGSVNSVYVGRDDDGNPQPINVGEVTFSKNFVRTLGVSLPCAVTSASVPTQAGDCGMPLVADSGNLKSILGIHVAAVGFMHTSSAMATLVSRSDIDNLLSKFENGGLDLVSANEPVLNGRSIKNPIGSVHPKSVFRYLEDGSATVYGSFTGFRAQHKSAVVPTKMSPFLEQIGIRTTCGPPVMRGFRPWRIAALSLVAPVAKIQDRAVRACSDAFVQDIIKSLPKEAFGILHKYDTFDALNGVHGVAYVDSVNRSTSAGFPFRRSKKHYLRCISPERGLQEPIELVDEVKERIADIREKYQRGDLYRPVFIAHLKDEAVKASKMASGKTRVFCGAPLDWTIVVREYFLSHIRLIQNYKFDFECAVGTISQSVEWSRVFSHVTKYGQDRVIAGDYAAFDKTMPPVIILESFRVLIELAKYSGNFTDGDCRTMWCIAYDTAYGMVDYNGELVTFWGSNPSGHPLTVIINSIANSLYVRLAYSKTHAVESFKDDVSLLTYGDDNIMSVREGCRDFNHTYLADTFAEMGITYTMADKEAESVPFVNIADASFLKRSWRYDHTAMVYAAPLDEESIHKSLCVCVRSKTIAFDHQMTELIRNAHAEWWRYGPEKFAWCDKMLKDLIRDCDLESWFIETPLPSSDAYWQRFWASSEASAFVL